MFRVKKLIGLLENLFFVPRCSGCGERLLPDCSELYAICLCEKCYDAWNKSKREICFECGKEVCSCMCTIKGDFADSLEGFPKLAFYHPDKSEETANRIIYSLKYTDDCRLARFLADELAVRIAVELKRRKISPDRCLYTWVPRRAKSVSKYGFDQGERLCGCVAKICGGKAIKIFSRCGGKEQKKLKKGQRANNIRSHIKLRRRTFDIIKDYDCVVLIDDLATTGATACAAQDLIKNSGAEFLFAAVEKTFMNTVMSANTD